LIEIKLEGESFSELFERLIGSVGPSLFELLKKLRGYTEFKDKKHYSKRSVLRRGKRRA